MRYAFLAAVAACQFAAAQPAAPLSIDLAGALERAKAYSQPFLSAGIASSLAREDRTQARAAFFPTISQLNQFIYTQPNGTPSGVFVANDGPHIYNEQALVHAELFSPARQAEYRRAQWAEAGARARQEVAYRGLAATVIQNYYAMVIALRRESNAERSLDEAKRFLDISDKQEQGGEVAHADVVKAQLQFAQRQRDLMDARTNTEKARLALGVLLFADMNQRFDIIDDLAAESALLPPPEEVRSRAFNGNPDLRAAEAGVRQAEYGIKAARGAYMPTFAIDYFYGIDANVFGIRGPDGRQNLGSVAQGTVTVPIWNWGITRSKVRQAELQKRQADLDLTFTKRQTQAAVDGLYLEVTAARAQLESLRRSVALAEQSVRLTMLRYEGGEATALEVVDAQTTLVQTRNAYDDGLARYRVAKATLETLTGKL